MRRMDTHQTHAGDRKEASWWKWYLTDATGNNGTLSYSASLFCSLLIKQTNDSFLSFFFSEKCITHTHTHTWGDFVGLVGRSWDEHSVLFSEDGSDWLGSRSRRKLPSELMGDSFARSGCHRHIHGGQGACLGTSVTHVGRIPPLSHSGHQLELSPSPPKCPRCWYLLPLSLQPSSIIPWGRGGGLSWMFRGPAAGQGKRGGISTRRKGGARHKPAEWHVVQRTPSMATVELDCVSSVTQMYTTLKGYIGESVLWL